MKKFIFIFLVSIIGYGQDDKYVETQEPNQLTGKVVENKKDEFTGDYKIQVNAMRGNRFKNSDKITEGWLIEPIFLSVNYKKTNEKKFTYLNLEILQSSGFNNLCVSNYDGQLFIILENNEKVNLKQFSEVECDAVLDPKYTISDNDLLKLSKYKISKIRVYYTKNYGDYIIREDRKALILNTFQVLKEQISRIIQ